MKNGMSSGSPMKQRPMARVAGQSAPKAFGVLQKGAPGKAFGVIRGGGDRYAGLSQGQKGTKVSPKQNTSAKALADRKKQTAILGQQ